MAKYPRGKVKETVWIDRDCVRTLVISNASLQPRSIEHDERMGIVIERIIGMRLEGVRQNEVSVTTLEGDSRQLLANNNETESFSDCGERDCLFDGEMHHEKSENIEVERIRMHI